MTELHAKLHDVVVALSRMQGDDSLDGKVQAWVAAKAAHATLKEVFSAAQDSLVEYMQEHPDEHGNPAQFQMGDKRYYIGVKSSHKMKDATDAVVAMLDAGGGDMSAVAACIAADGIKPGAFRALVGDDVFAENFRTELVREVRTGKPKVGLQVIDEKFMRASNKRQGVSK